jgi:hypothetical protein
MLTDKVAKPFFEDAAAQEVSEAALLRRCGKGR